MHHYCPKCGYYVAVVARAGDGRAYCFDCSGPVYDTQQDAEATHPRQATMITHDYGYPKGMGSCQNCQSWRLTDISDTALWCEDCGHVNTYTVEQVAAFYGKEASKW